ncbi:exogenous ferric siderophore receptor [Polaromonas sp.]|nr:exogenous ferric siderophore receptor [Polaromonas sp.]
MVSASGFEQEIKDAPASITVIERKELEQKRVSNLTDALADVEGIDVGAAAGKTGGLNISIRGMPSEYTLILVDGRRQNSAGNVTPNGFGETQTSFMPPVSAIERIEVIRGPMSTLYGSDAMGGVINIITRKVAKQWSGSASVDYTLQQEAAFGDVRSGKFYISGPIKEDVFGLSVRASSQRRSAADVHYVGNNEADVVPSMGANPVKAQLDTVGLRFALTPNRDHDITLDLDSGRQKYDNSKGQLGTRTIRGGYGPELRYNRNQVALAHTGRFGFGRWDSSLMRNNTETTGRNIPPGTPGAAPGSPRTLEVKSTVLDSKLVSAFGAHIMTVGGQWWDTSMRDAVAPGAFTFTQKALFMEDEWRLQDNLGITFGGRYDRHSTFGGHFSPRVYGVWTASPNWTVKGGVSNGYKTPSVEMLADGINGFGGQGTIPLIGNPKLKPETSTATEFGANFDSLAGFTAGFTVFNNTFKDKITSGPGLQNCSYGPNPNRPGCVSYGQWPNVDEFGQRINVDKATTRGVELNTRLPITPSLYSRANYTFTKSEQKSGSNSGKPLTDTPRHSVNASLHWEPGNEWSAWLRGEYRSNRFRDPGTSASNIAAKETLGDYKSYAQFHLGGAYKVSKQFTLNATLYNVFNKNFIDYAPYTTKSAKPVTSYSNRYVNSQEGRRLWVSANYTF